LDRNSAGLEVAALTAASPRVRHLLGGPRAGVLLGDRALAPVLTQLPAGAPCGELEPWCMSHSAPSSPWNTLRGRMGRRRARCFELRRALVASPNVVGTATRRGGGVLPWDIPRGAAQLLLPSGASRLLSASDASAAEPGPLWKTDVALRASSTSSSPRLEREHRLLALCAERKGPSEFAEAWPAQCGAMWDISPL
jgi:hypothetical protein